MEIRIKATGQVMYDSVYRQYLLDNNGPSFDELTTEVMAELGIDPVLEGPQAATTPPYEISIRAGVEQIGDAWFTKYVIGPVFADDASRTAYRATMDATKAASVREDRNNRLADCDWTQLADSTVDRSVWASYRTMLRNISADAGFPWSVTWPVSP
jgi:hypothetical protein